MINNKNFFLKFNLIILNLLYIIQLNNNPQTTMKIKNFNII